MHPSRAIITALLLTGLSLAACRRHEPPEAQAGAGTARGAPAIGTATLGTPPAPWEPIDKGFKGCEGS